MAVFWDFENLVAGRYDSVHGKFSWRDDGKAGGALRRDRAREVRLDVTAILDHALSLSGIVLNRAYCDWSRPEFRDYGAELAKHDVELIQQFSRSTGKNGADIRIAIDVVEELRWNNEITDVLVCSGDSDFLPLVEFCLRTGRRIHGVGVEGSVSDVWRSTCEFNSYQDLTAPERVIDLAGARLSLSKDAAPTVLLRETLQRIPAGQWVQSAHLVSLMRRFFWPLDLAGTDFGTADGLVAAAASDDAFEVDGGPRNRVRLRAGRESGASPAAPMDRDDSGRVVAVYWDLESLVSEEYNRVNGKGRWSSDRVDRWIPPEFAPRVAGARIDVSALLEFIRSIGIVAVNRMYADWTRKIFKDYHWSSSERTATDFVQVHHLISGLMRFLLPMAVVADVERNPAITDVVICGGDDGFPRLADYCGAKGIRLHAVGTKAVGNAEWRAATAFTRYVDVVTPRADPVDLDWETLLMTCVPEGDGGIVASTLKLKMLEIDVAFSEKTFGFRTFGALLQAASAKGLVTLEDEGTRKWVRRAMVAAE